MGRATVFGIVLRARAPLGVPRWAKDTSSSTFRATDERPPPIPRPGLRWRALRAHRDHLLVEDDDRSGSSAHHPRDQIQGLRHRTAARRCGLRQYDAEIHWLLTEASCPHDGSQLTTA